MAKQKADHNGRTRNKTSVPHVGDLFLSPTWETTTLLEPGFIPQSLGWSGAKVGDHRSRNYRRYFNHGLEASDLCLTRRRLLRNAALMASGSLCASWASGLAETAGDAQTWTIGNELVKRVLVFRPRTAAPVNIGLFTQEFSDLSIGASLIPRATALMGEAGEFSFHCNGEVCTGGSGVFDLVGASESAIPGGKSLAVRLRHWNLALEVTVVYRVYDGHAAIRKHLVLRNTGSTPLHVSHMDIEAIGVSLGPANEITLLTQYGAVPREIFYTGRSEDACLLLANGVNGQGIAVMNEAPGYMKRTEIAGWDDPEYTRIGVMYDTDLMPFERTSGRGRGVHHGLRLAGFLSQR